MAPLTRFPSSRNLRHSFSTISIDSTSSANHPWYAIIEEEPWEIAQSAVSNSAAFPDGLIGAEIDSEEQTLFRSLDVSESQHGAASGHLRDTVTDDDHCGSGVSQTIANAPLTMMNSRRIDDAVRFRQHKTFAIPKFNKVDNMLTKKPPIYTELPSYVSDYNDTFFRDLCLNRHNLVLDSIHPDIPHIVITPPADDSNVLTLLSQNRLNMQSLDYLMVPQYPLRLLSCMPPPVDGSSHLEPAIFYDSRTTDTRTNDISLPRPVFSPRRFANLIEHSSTERLIMYHVICAIHKHQWKAIAFMVSDIATSFRTRYDCPEFIRKLDKPFQWTDPAEPLILASRYHLGTTVIDSVCPFTAPHIIINESPPESPWIAWNNATNNPQDCDHGRSLTVPSSWVSFVNDDLTHADDPDADASRVDLGEDTSPPDSPVPSTPVLDGLYEGENAFVVSVSWQEECASSGGTASICGEERLRPELTYATVGLERPSCDIFAGRYGDDDDDDDDDDLPPFDDWYTSVLERTRLAH